MFKPRTAEHTPTEKKVWTYYDQEVAKRIVHEALKASKLKPITLKEIYDALSLARKKCEWVKNQNPATTDEIEYYSYQEISAFQSNFGSPITKTTTECYIYNEKNWGTEAVALTRQRLGSLDVSGAMLAYSALSMYGSSQNTLYHPGKYLSILEIIEDEFQTLLQSNSLFASLKIASRIQYALSNFPPIYRGSKAVNTWLIRDILNEKFGINVDIQPKLFDWLAYYETPEHYTASYTISATVNYLKSIPVLSNKHSAFYDNLLALLTLDPNNTQVLEQREKAWSDLKHHISTLLNDNDIPLSTEQQKHLQNILEGMLTFRKPSNLITLFLHTGEITENNRDHLLTLLRLHEELSDHYLVSYGDPLKEEKLNQLWVDLECLRKRGDSALKEIKTAINFTPANNPITFAPKSSNTNSDLLSTLKKEHPSLAAALLCGGMLESDLTNLSNESIEALTSPAALLLYNSNRFIHAKDLISNNTVDIKRNILEHITMIFCNDDKDTVKDTIRRLDEVTLDFFLMPSELYLTKNSTLSELIGEGEEETYRKVLKAILRDVYQEAVNIHFIDSASLDQLSDFIYNSQQIIEASLKKSITPTKFLSSNNLKASVLMQLNYKEVSFLLTATMNKKEPFSKKEQQAKLAYDELMTTMANLSPESSGPSLQ